MLNNPMSEINKLPKCIDFHTHIYPQNQLRSSLSESTLQKIKGASKYYSSISHAVQQKMHLVPESLRKSIDPVLLSFTLPTLAVNSTIEDLQIEIRQNNLTCAVVASHPTQIPNQFILEQTALYKNSVPCLTLTQLESDQAFFDLNDLRMPKFLLKINPMAQDFNLNNETTQNILELWNQNAWPLLVHTGALYSSFFKHPEAGNINSLSTLVSRYPKIHFILLHMNIFKPYEALEFCTKYENTSVSTSWQSQELITVATKKLGSERVLFSSDWPLVGNNIEIRKNQIIDLMNKNYLTEQETENILFSNAKNILEKYLSKNLDSICNKTLND